MSAALFFQRERDGGTAARTIRILIRIVLLLLAVVPAAAAAGPRRP